jgi:hypothetical protein
VINWAANLVCQRVHCCGDDARFWSGVRLVVSTTRRRRRIFTWKCVRRLYWYFTRGRRRIRVEKCAGGRKRTSARWKRRIPSWDFSRIVARTALGDQLGATNSGESRAFHLVTTKGHCLAWDSAFRRGARPLPQYFTLGEDEGSLLRLQGTRHLQSVAYSRRVLSVNSPSSFYHSFQKVASHPRPL